MLVRELDSKAETGRLPVVVQKYGGSSLADVDKLGRVAERVVAARRSGHDVVVVVSAMGKATDELLKLAHQVSAHGRPDAEPPRRELDMLVSTGERVTMALLSIAIQARGLKAISFTGSQCDIITNDQHFDARIIEVRPHRIEDELARGCVVIVAGYQGMSYKREITTLGRGGSDTTAVALAAALEADRCEIYSDVDGVYSADPRVVSEAEHLGEVGYEMLQQMAESGAKVLCAQAVEWARKAGVAIYARSTFDAISDRPRQTLVRRHGPGQQPRARAVVGDANVVLARVPKSAGPAGLATAVQLLAEAGVRYRELSTTDEDTAMVVSLTGAPQWKSARRELERRLPGISIREDVAQISVAGGGLNDDADRLVQFRQTLAAMGAEPLWLSASALRLSAVIPEQHAAEAQQRLHRQFVAED